MLVSPFFHSTRHAASAAAGVMPPALKCDWSLRWVSQGAMATRAL